MSILKKGENLMKKKLFVVSVLVLALMLAFSTSVALAGKPNKAVGERFFVYDGSQVFAAGEAFHIEHGLFFGYEIGEPIGNSFGLNYMTLEIDGVQQKPDYRNIDFDLSYKEDGWRLVTKTYLFNFSEGMKGTHTFTRRYFLTCESISEQLMPLDCDYPAQMIEWTDWNQTTMVSFE
jgi:hypothetical protein